jgi:hypothetical protein
VIPPKDKQTTQDTDGFVTGFFKETSILLRHHYPNTYEQKRIGITAVK